LSSPCSFLGCTLDKPVLKQVVSRTTQEEGKYALDGYIEGRAFEWLAVARSIPYRTKVEFESISVHWEFGRCLVSNFFGCMDTIALDGKEAEAFARHIIKVLRSAGERCVK